MKRRRPSEVATGLPLRKRRRRLVESVLFLIGCLLLLDSLIGERGVVANKRADAIYARQQEELTAAHDENERLQQELQRLTDDPATIEDAARRDLGLMKPGEKVFMIDDAKPGADTH